MDYESIKALLDQKYEAYNVPGFITDDPISIPHRFSKKEDIEISAFLAATIAWGRRSMIIKNANLLINHMENSPYDYVMNATERDVEIFGTFVHRTFNGIDAVAWIKCLQYVYQQSGGLEAIFSNRPGEGEQNVYNNIIRARKIFTEEVDFPTRSHKHFANPAKGSSAKRINMFLRWMVRKDQRGVDFGIWNSILPKQLICPLDVHTGSVSRKLGILERKQNDWKAAESLTNVLKIFCPEDPVKYDFSLFGLGVVDKF